MTGEACPTRMMSSLQWMMSSQQMRSAQLGQLMWPGVLRLLEDSPVWGLSPPDSFLDPTGESR